MIHKDSFLKAGSPQRRRDCAAITPRKKSLTSAASLRDLRASAVKRHSLFAYAMTMCLLAVAFATSANAQTKDTLREGFAFYFKDFKLEHQGELHTLNITVRYDYVSGIADKDYPDYVPMAKLVEDFLVKYPNENTYWEIVNKQLTQRLLDEYPALAEVTVELQVSPSKRFHLVRASTVTRTRPSHHLSNASRPSKITKTKSKAGKEKPRQ
jgi:hypothetical protein